jgi:hypothetical protein
MSKGEALLVSAVLERQAGWKFGTLRIAMFEDPAFAWFSRRGEEAILPPPIQIDDIREARGEERRHMKVPRFRVLVIHAAGQPWKVAVPTPDVPLVRSAFSRTDPTRGV